MVWGSLVSPPSAKAQCPSTEKLLPGIKKTFPKLQFEIVKINPTEAPGLCQIQIKIGAQIHLLYSDSRGEFFLAGNLFEAKTGRNLTQEAVQLLTRLTPDEMRQIEELTAFTLGQGKKVVYLVTDPKCPYCKQAESLLKKLLEKEDFQVRFLLFPLDMHKGAREQSIAILCDRQRIRRIGERLSIRPPMCRGDQKSETARLPSFRRRESLQLRPLFSVMEFMYPG